MQLSCHTAARLYEKGLGVYFIPMALSWPSRSVFNDADEPTRLQTFTPFSGGVTRPLGRVLAGGLAVVVRVREVEKPVHPYRDEGFIGLERDSVGMHRVKLIGYGAIGTGGNEIADALDRAELREEGGHFDGLFHNALRVNELETDREAEREVFLGFGTEVVHQFLDHGLVLDIEGAEDSVGVVSAIEGEGVLRPSAEFCHNALVCLVTPMYMQIACRTTGFSHFRCENPSKPTSKH